MNSEPGKNLTFILDLKKKNLLGHFPCEESVFRTFHAKWRSTIKTLIKLYWKTKYNFHFSYEFIELENHILSDSHRRFSLERVQNIQTLFYIIFVF